MFRVLRCAQNPRQIPRPPFSCSHLRHSPSSIRRPFSMMTEDAVREPVDGPLVWIDCEMSGLDPKKYRLLEIAVRVSWILGFPLINFANEGYSHRRKAEA